MSLYRDDPELCKRDLAKYLVKGELSLFLGAGISASVGMPNWKDLTKNVLINVGFQNEANKISDQTTDAEYRNLMTKVRKELNHDAVKFKEIVKKSLYSKDKLFDLGNFVPPLLSSLGAMMMGSKRGSVKQVVTLNYDNVLELYLSYHGFYTQSVSVLPVRLRDADVTIYHPHGYLPHGSKDEDSEDIILDQHSYDCILGAETDSPWRKLTRNILKSKVVLCVGLSNRDPNLNTLVGSVMKEMTKAGLEQPVGFWLHCDEDAKDEEFEELTKFVPVRVRRHKDYPQFILDICKKASILYKKNMMEL